MMIEDRHSSTNVSTHHHHISRSKLRIRDGKKEDDEKPQKNATLHPSALSTPPQNRGRAVTASDHKLTMVHSQFESMTLEEVALRALSAEVAGKNVREECGGLAGPRTLAQAMAQRKATPMEKTPTSLFVLKEDNIMRRYTKFIIEWPYPFMLVLKLAPSRVLLSLSKIKL
ncbi:uncharacterized protein LOC143233226 [Tachypleus tridentatus]|uniref:uncharacterized protein LOC143233226 n=1 Tax=Tachypleus tridentatus TaxID=6853 RepID=UPI003FD2DC08